MKLLGLAIGLIGVFMLILYPPAGCFTMIFGSLFFLAGSNRQKRKLEARRHQEMVDAMRKGQG